MRYRNSEVAGRPASLCLRFGYDVSPVDELLRYFHERHLAKRELELSIRKTFSYSRRSVAWILSRLDEFLCFCGSPEDWVGFCRGDWLPEKPQPVTYVPRVIDWVKKPPPLLLDDPGRLHAAPVVASLAELPRSPEPPANVTHAFVMACILRFCFQNGWRARKEVPFGSSRADVVAWSGNRAMAFEVKVSLGDYLAELAKPWKRKPICDGVDEFWFVVPYTLSVPPPPDGCGLLSCGKRGRLTVRMQGVVIPPH